MVVISVGSLFFWYFQHEEKQQQRMRIEENALKVYAQTADFLRMEIDYSDYGKRENVDDITLTPTKRTKEMMERWKAVSEAFPTIEFPQKEVGEGNWIKVYEEITKSIGEMRSVPLVLSNGEEVGGTESLYLYVHNGNIEEDNFENLLKEKGIIE
jgi:glutaredoxin